MLTREEREEFRDELHREAYQDARETAQHEQLLASDPDYAYDYIYNNHFEPIEKDLKQIKKLCEEYGIDFIDMITDNV